MVQMRQETYDAAMSTAKEAWNSKPGKDKVDLGMTYLNASPLHMAALQGDLDFVKTVLEEIPQLAEAIDSRNQTPLHLASAEGHIDIVKELVSANVDTCTYQDIRGRNPLHVAVMKGHLGVVKELVKSENVADMCADMRSDMCMSRDLGGRNPLHVAVVKGKVDVIEELLKACPLAAHERGERDETILHMSVKHNHLQVLKLLLGKLELQELVHAKDADGNTALHLAVAKDTKVEIVEALCCGGIDVNVKNVNEHTALDMLPESKPRRGNNNTTLQPQVEEQEKKKERIEQFMRVGGALRAKQIRSADWLTRKKDSLMVVAALIATGAFQTGMTIPAGLLKGGNSSHQSFVKFNTAAFFASVSAILLIASDYSRKSWYLLVVQFGLIAAAAASMGMSYAIAASATMSKKDDGKIQGPLISVLRGLSTLIYFIALAGVVIAFALLRQEGTSKRKARMRRNWPEHTIQDPQPQVNVNVINP